MRHSYFVYPQRLICRNGTHFSFYSSLYGCIGQEATFYFKWSHLIKQRDLLRNLSLTPFLKEKFKSLRLSCDSNFFQFISISVLRLVGNRRKRYT